MPRIDLISKDETIRIGDAEGYFLIRRLPSEVAREIRERHTKRVESGEPRAESREETDWAEVELDQLDYIIQDWLVHGPDGAPAPCTRANKAALPAATRVEVMAAAGAVNLAGDPSAPLRPWSAPSGPPAPAGGSTSVILTETTAAPSERIVS